MRKHLSSLPVYSRYDFFKKAELVNQFLSMPVVYDPALNRLAFQSLPFEYDSDLSRFVEIILNQKDIYHQSVKELQSEFDEFLKENPYLLNFSMILIIFRDLLNHCRC